jgi:hypothetical protein
VTICLDIKTAHISDIKDLKSLLGDSPMFRRLVGMFIFTSALASAAPTAYLPIGADNYLQNQVDHLFLLTGGNPMKKPYSIANIDRALNQIENTHPSLYQAVNNGLEPYRGSGSISRAGLVARVSADQDMPIANQRGLSSDEYLQAFAEGAWRPNDSTVVQAGVEYRADASALVPYNTFVGFSKGNLQLDLGYREHWYSPFSFSSQLISNNAEMGPSITLSTVSPIQRFWQAKVELFYTRLDKVKNGIRYLDQWYDGSPHLIGTHLSISPTKSWTLGFNRMLQFGGGPREVSTGDIVNAFFNPVKHDNSFSEDEITTEFGDQMASVTTSYQLNRGMPIEIYAELAAEDTQGHSNFSLGNQAINLGIFMPQISDKIALRYEFNRYKTAWYVNHLYAFGNTNNGFVFGNYIADQRDFGHGIPATANKISLDYATSGSAGWTAFLSTINQQDKSRYDTAYEFKLEHRRKLQQNPMRLSVTLGSSVYSENYGQLEGSIFWH